MEFEKPQSPFGEKWDAVVTASRAAERHEDYEYIDSVLTPELVRNTESVEDAKFLFERMTEESEPDWVVRDAAVAALNDKAMTGKIQEFGLGSDLKATMEAALVQDGFPWISANAMNWLVNYTNPDDKQRQAIVGIFKSRAESLAEDPKAEFAKQWAKPVLAEEISFLPEIPEIAEWLETS
jgi:hypothetical protein